MQSALDDDGKTESWLENYYNDLSGSIEAARGAGREIIVGGDFNKEAKEKGLMQKTFLKHGMVNLFQEIMHDVPPTRRGGRRTIDHIWVTPEMFGAISKAGIVAQDKIFSSDHVGMFVDVDVAHLGEKMAQDSRQPRFLKSGNARNVRRYLKEVKEKVVKMKLKRAAERMKHRVLSGRLRNKLEIKAALDKIDRKLQEVLLSVEESLRPAQQETSCERLWELKRIRKYWRVLAYPKKSITREALRNIWGGGSEEDLRLAKKEKVGRLREAQESVMSHYQKQTEYRDAFLAESAEKAGAAGEKEKEKAILEIKKQEKQNRQYRYLKRVLKPWRGTESPEVELLGEIDEVDEMWEMLKEKREEPES